MIVLAGGNTLIGKSLLPKLRNVQQVCAFDCEQGDPFDAEFLKKLFEDAKPDIFINTIQMDDIEECEYKKEDAYKCNSFLPELLAKFCSEYDTKLLNFSSSYIFDGQKEIAYTEIDQPKPISVYGDSKYLAEQKILESGCRSLIIRVPDLIGESSSFVKNIIEPLKNLHSITVIKKQKVCPTFVDDLADAVLNLLNLNAEGIFNFSNSNDVQIADFIYNVANFYTKFSSLPLDFNVNEVDPEENLSPVDWPNNNTLNCDKYVNLTKEKIPSWKNALKVCLQENYNSY